MDPSPIARLLADIDRLDLEAVAASFAPDADLLMVDGRRAHGIDALREVLGEFISHLRATTHEVTAQWHEDGVWIAELDATYELQDYSQTGPLPRALILREGPEGIHDLRVYGAHEHLLAEHRTGEEGMWVGQRWIPPL